MRVHANPALADVVSFESRSKDACTIRLANIKRCTSNTDAYHYEIQEALVVA